MVKFAIRRCPTCEAERLARVSTVAPFEVMVVTTQCWRCGHTTVQHYQSTQEAIKAFAVLGVVHAS